MANLNYFNIKVPVFEKKKHFICLDHLKEMSSTIISRKNAPVKPDAQVMGELEEKKIYNTSYTTCPCQDLVYNDDDYSKERRLCKECCDDYGIKPMTKEELDEERALSWAIIKRLTMAVLSMDFTSFSFPVGYS